MRQPGVLLGLGPVQAAREDVAGALSVRAFGASWFTRGDVPSGVLATDQPINATQADEIKARWKATADGEVRILGQGLSYTPITIKPADAQWLDSRRFTTEEIARLMGVPASLLLLAIQGSSETYANVEQEWIGYVRFSLMRFLREIEEAVTDALPRGQVARFNLESLLRSDTKTRYEAHKIAIDSGFLTVNEVRAIEWRPPLPAKGDSQ